MSLLRSAITADETPDIVTDPIYLSAPDMSGHERAALLRAFDEGWIAPVGPELDAFEQELAQYVGAEACVALSSGTAALHLGLLAVGVKPGDRVIVQSSTFAASAFAVAHAGATPVFCDVDRRTWNIDPRRLERWLETQRADSLPTAIVPVDLYGLCPDYVELARVAERFEIPIVEDAAEALGSMCGEIHASSFGTVGAISFNGNKIITTSGGGALVGSRDAMERVRYLATQARQPTLHYEHIDIGYNYRMSNLLAALGRAQLSRLEDGIARRTQIRDRYMMAFPDWGWLTSATTDRPNNWLAVAQLPTALDPTEICHLLAESHIEARPLWKPMHSQPIFADAETIGGEIGDEMYRRGICLPTGSGMSPADQNRVIAALRSAVAKS